MVTHLVKLSLLIVKRQGLPQGNCTTHRVNIEELLSNCISFQGVAYIIIRRLKNKTYSMYV